MKRVGNLHGLICSFENLMAAAYRARRGKRFRPDVALYRYHLESQVLRLRDELASQTCVPGKYRTFRIFDPKPRRTSAAP